MQARRERERERDTHGVSVTEGGPPTGWISRGPVPSYHMAEAAGRKRMVVGETECPLYRSPNEILSGQKKKVELPVKTWSKEHDNL